VDIGVGWVWHVDITAQVVDQHQLWSSIRVRCRDVNTGLLSAVPSRGWLTSGLRVAGGPVRESHHPQWCPVPLVYDQAKRKEGIMTEQTPGSDRPHQSPDQGQGPQSGSPWPHQPAAGAGHPGDLGKRFVARLIDGILVGIVYGIISFIIGALIQPSGVVAPGQAAGAAWLSTFVTAVITVAINLGY